MGQKVNPIGLRIGINQTWRSKWFADKGYKDLLKEDLEIREYIQKKLHRAGISRIEIERTANQVKVDIYTARPGIVIGRKGSQVDSLRSDLEKRVDKQIQLNIQEVLKPELDANLVAQNVAQQLEARVSFRRAMKRAVSATLKRGGQGIRISCAGRLGGAEMARNEWYRQGRVPLHTLRADIDYGFTTARTKFGSIGVKVWIYKGDIIPGKEGIEKKAQPRRLRKEKKPDAASQESKAQEGPKGKNEGKSQGKNGD